jgi:hypothetical protein
MDDIETIEMRRQIENNINEIGDMWLPQLMEFQSLLDCLKLGIINYLEMFVDIDNYLDELNLYIEIREKEWTQFSSGLSWEKRWGTHVQKWYDDFSQNYYIVKPYLSNYWNKLLDLLEYVQRCYRLFPGVMSNILNYDEGLNIYAEVEVYQGNLNRLSRDRNRVLGNLLPFLKKLSILQRGFYDEMDAGLDNIRNHQQNFIRRFLEGEVSPEFLAETEQVLFQVRYAIKNAFA